MTDLAREIAEQVGHIAVYEHFRDTWSEKDAFHQKIAQSARPVIAAKLAERDKARDERDATARKMIFKILHRVRAASNGVHNSREWDSEGPTDQLSYWEWIQIAETEALALLGGEKDED